MEPEVIQSSKIDSYRNKVEFTIGRKYDSEKQCVGDVCVGFNVGDASKGVTFVDSPAETKVNSAESLQAAHMCEDLIRKSGIEPYNKAKLEGLWRVFLYRESKVTNQCLISVFVTEAEQDKLTSELKSEIARTFSGQIGDKKIVSVSVIYASEMSGGYKETDRVEQL